MPERVVFASGTLPSGEEWSLTEARSEHSYTTMLTIWNAEESLFGRGMGGPPIAPGEHVNVYSGRQDRRFLGVVVRVNDSAARVLLQGATHDPVTEVPLFSPTLAAGVRVGGFGWAPPSNFTELVALDHQGSVVFRGPLAHLRMRPRSP